MTKIAFFTKILVDCAINEPLGNTGDLTLRLERADSGEGGSRKKRSEGNGGGGKER